MLPNIRKRRFYLYKFLNNSATGQTHAFGHGNRRYPADSTPSRAAPSHMLYSECPPL